MLFKDSLADALDANLLLSHRIRDFRPDRRAEEKLAASSAPNGSVIRLAKLADRILSIVAIPDGMPVAGIRRVLSKQWRMTGVLIVTERWLVRQPRLGNLITLVGASDHEVARTDRILLEQHLLENGGSSPLFDCAAYVLRNEDPIRAVLSLVADKKLRIDLTRPIGPSSLVSLPTRRSRGRSVMGH
ncbi:hypothetical protein GCM10007301_22830 [Azorhizobium oxalatiphilum]|uniref:Uncharacterized protein n=1 Tax=Azorhizobium oxalatiphilum TaxID=980631 RepID=A0A917BZG1_9HYPH|nr:hypothetical protein [Azorhizobium oxalatiphilum]GGF62538.1 hypothetical protein GCM10007301_22830 [Azorhizobium oxalatiphilum]